MALETTLFDPAEYVTTAEGVEAYLEGAFESNDAAVIQDAFGVVARSNGMSALASETGISRAALYKALSEKGNPEFATVLKVAKALGFELRPVRRPPATATVRYRSRKRAAPVMKAALKA